jgi:uncharacterized membrane protein
MYGLALTLHILAAIIWIGGMFFAFVALRPALNALLEPAQRLPLWAQIFSRFFAWVWGAIIMLFATGLWIMFQIYGGMGTTPIYVHVMLTLGLIMTLLFSYLFFIPYQKMRRAVQQHDIPVAARQLVYIRRVIDTNLTLGIITTIIASGVRYWV